jgi:hypothetical protein
MKIRFGCGVFLTMAFSMAAVVAATAQSGAVGGQVNPTAVSSSARDTAMPVEDNGARPEPGEGHAFAGSQDGARV